MNESTRANRTRLLLACALLATVLAYWIGLSGPFLLDDPFSLSAIPEWLAGKISLSTLLFERGAGTFGRPVSMASFAFNAWVGGYAPFPLKLGNLIIHLFCGLSLFGLLQSLLRRDPLLQPRASLYAAIVATLWLLHPLHASTVLYVVQRMAQLSTLFMLLGLWLYVLLRERLERGVSLPATLGLLLGIPAMTVLAFLSKENGLLLPLLCATVELAYFNTKSRPTPARVFLWLYAYLPIAAGFVVFALRPGRILDGYIRRDFTMTERLLSQPRILCDYLWQLVVPNPPRMGVYTDDFAVSTGLLSPPTTLICGLLLLGISLAAWRWRKALPAVFFGWFFFLAAHALEAGPISLELYFEHRNYLPSVGILTLLLSLAVAAGQALARNGVQTQRIGVVMLVGIAAVFVLGTHGRARVWQSDLLIAESALRSHPTSVRANGAVLLSAMARRDEATASQAIDRLIGADAPRTQSLGHLYRLYKDCVSRGSGQIEDLQAFLDKTPLPLTIAETRPFMLIYQATPNGGCGPVTDRMLGNALVQLADRAIRQGDREELKWKTRYYAASFLVRAGDWETALPQARKAWQPGAHTPVALPLVLSQLHAGDVAGAKQTHLEAVERSDKTNTDEQTGLRWLKQQIEAGTNSDARN